MHVGLCCGGHRGVYTEGTEVNQPQIVTRPCVVGLDTDQYCEYFGLLPNGLPFVIFRPRENWEYSQFRCFIDGMEVAVKSVERYRDGGTTNVELGRPGEPHRIFNFPTPFKPELKPTYDGKEIAVYERI